MKREVPDMISDKDLLYLIDMYKWNYGAYKCSIDAVNKSNDSDVIKIYNKAIKMFKTNMDNILVVLEKGGTK